MLPMESAFRVQIQPTLSSDLRNGFPLGEFDGLLLNSYDHPNHKNAFPHINEIFSYIQDEVALGRMSGPFTWDELKKEAQGNVIVSPLGAVDKAGEPGKLRIIRDLSFKGRAPFSVNDKIDKNAFTTKWGTAAMVIDLVRASYHFPLSILRPRWHLSSSSLLASARGRTQYFCTLTPCKGASSCTLTPCKGTFSCTPYAV
jgi:hypothetical protein